MLNSRLLTTTYVRENSAKKQMKARSLQFAQPRRQMLTSTYAYAHTTRAMIAHVWRDIPKGEEATRREERTEEGRTGQQMKDNHFRLRNKKGPTCRIDDRPTATDRTFEGRERGRGQHGRMSNEQGVSHEELDGGRRRRHPFVGSGRPNTVFGLYRARLKGGPQVW